MSGTTTICIACMPESLVVYMLHFGTTGEQRVSIMNFLVLVDSPIGSINIPLPSVIIHWKDALVDAVVLRTTAGHCTSRYACHNYIG